MDLCEGCQEFKSRLFEIYADTGTIPFVNVDIHKNFSELSDCADAFCDLCKYFRRELCYYAKDDQPYAFDVKDLEKTIDQVTVAIQSEQATVQLYLGDCGQSIRADLGNYTTPVPLKYDVDGLLVLGREWLSNCIAKHKNCDLHVKDTCDFLPIRLIEVGQPGQQSIRLVLSECLLNRTKHVAYATLSYCWGEGPHTASTTDENLEKRLDTIPLRLLPRTIQDAVHITRVLDIQYLWVDALCILQNPESKDWQREFPNMGKVYSHSLLTIAASGVKGSSGGCFYKRDAALWPVSGLLLTETTSEYQRPHAALLNPTLPAWSSSVKHSALGKRGWAVQERMLSRRTLSWTEDGLFWDCAEGMTSEHMASGNDYNPTLTGRGRLPLHEVIRDINDSTVPHPSATGFHAWCEVLEEFSGKALTVATDRLPAVVGLGNELSRLTGNVCDFDMNMGVWKSNLIQELAWVTCNDVSGKRVPMEARATEIPSWSWASIHEQIHFPGIHAQEYRMLVKVLSSKLPELLLVGRMGAVNIRRTTSDFTIMPYDTDDFGKRVNHVGDGRGSRVYHVGPRMFEPVRPTYEREADLSWHDKERFGRKEIAVLDSLADAITSETGPVQCIQWIKYKDYCRPVDSMNRWHYFVTGCIIVAPVCKRSKIYRRIGWLEAVDLDIFDDEDEIITLI